MKQDEYCLELPKGVQDAGEDANEGRLRSICLNRSDYPWSV